MRVCKEFLQEWEGEGTEGTEETRTRQEEMKRKEFERKQRFKIVDKKRKKAQKDISTNQDKFLSEKSWRSSKTKME